MQVRCSIPQAAHLSPRKTGTAFRGRGTSGPHDALTRLHGVIGEVAEEAIDAERIEGFVFRRRFALEVGGQALRLAAEGPGEHLEAGGMGSLTTLDGSTSTRSRSSIAPSPLRSSGLPSLFLSTCRLARMYGFHGAMMSA